MIIHTDGATVGHNGKLGTVSKVGLGMYIPFLSYGDWKLDDGISNNEAEFKALLWAMDIAIEKKIYDIEFLLDSQIVVNRCNGKRPGGRFKNERMDAFQDEVKKKEKNFNKVSYIWVPREANEVADWYSKQAVQSVNP